MTNKAQSVEASQNEVFIGNVSSIKGAPVCIPEYLNGLKTIRLGKQAYSLEGGKLSPKEFLPLFIDRSEVKAHDQIMMKQTFPNQKIW
ncbi:hypothetical protein ACTG16_23440 [Aeromonas sp. 23P]|uniref:hypothetical protein n=1 Tax=Aeromonas sp. 23P TaxID=3452716 RepID=UPI003F791D9B|nr:hypothetical protein [Aeromonas veronii]